MKYEIGEEGVPGKTRKIVQMIAGNDDETGVKLLFYEKMEDGRGRTLEITMTQIEALRFLQELRYWNLEKADETEVIFGGVLES